MLPPNTIITELTRPIDQAQRQTNYLILRTLEHKLDPALFTNLLQQVSQKHFLQTQIGLQANGPA